VRRSSGKVAGGQLVTELLRGAPHRNFGRGEVIFHAGDAGYDVHVVESGHVAIQLTTPDGEVATVTVLGPGELFGEGALFSDDERRSATAIALESVETRAVNRDAFETLRTEDRGVDDFLMCALTTRLRDTTDHLLEALFVGVETRVLRRLLTLAEQYADEGGDIVLPVSQEDVASMAGTTRPTANRVLRGAEQDGLIALGRGRITVLDRTGIEKRAR
jgi:CRP/FNR family cyclic AMP-dependent transcriptional regulator